MGVWKLLPSPGCNFGGLQRKMLGRLLLLLLKRHQSCLVCGFFLWSARTSQITLCVWSGARTGTLCFSDSICTEPWRRNQIPCNYLWEKASDFTYLWEQQTQFLGQWWIIPPMLTYQDAPKIYLNRSEMGFCLFVFIFGREGGLVVLRPSFRFCVRGSLLVGFEVPIDSGNETGPNHIPGQHINLGTILQAINRCFWKRPHVYCPHLSHLNGGKKRWANECLFFLPETAGHRTHVWTQVSSFILNVPGPCSSPGNWVKSSSIVLRAAGSLTDFSVSRKASLPFPCPISLTSWQYCSRPDTLMCNPTVFPQCGKEQTSGLHQNPVLSRGSHLSSQDFQAQSPLAFQDLV